MVRNKTNSSLQTNRNSDKKKEDGSWAKSNDEKVDIFSRHLTSIFTPHPEVFDPTHARLVEQSLSIPLQLAHPPKAFHVSEVENTNR